MINQVLEIAKKKGYVIYDQPYRLNIWGVRSATTTPNAFDDEMHVFLNIATTGKPKWFYAVFKCTTDPGTFWLKNPMNPQGTAILNADQYVDAYAIGMHRGKYKALVQVGNVTVTRDYDRDSILDFNNGRITKGKFGINIHHASSTGSTLYVDKYSAGCQVFKNIHDFDFFMKLCELHRQFYGNKFTYTLIDDRMDSKEKLKMKVLVIGSVLIGLVLGGIYLIQSDDENATQDQLQ